MPHPPTPEVEAPCPKTPKTPEVETATNARVSDSTAFSEGSVTAHLSLQTIERISQAVTSSVEAKLKEMEARIDIKLHDLAQHEDEVLDEIKVEQEKEKALLEEFLVGGERSEKTCTEFDTSRTEFAKQGEDNSPTANNNDGVSSTKATFVQDPQEAEARPMFGESMRLNMKAGYGPNTLRSELDEDLKQRNQRLSISPIQATFGSLVGCSQFDIVFGFLIVANALVIGAEVEYRTSHSETHSGFVVLSYIFCAIFGLELSARLLAAGPHIAIVPDRFWILFDSSMVVVSFADIVSYHMGFDGQVLRTIRIVRLMRIARVFRFVPQLHMIIFSILECLRCLFWFLILLMIILYVFSLCFTMAATEFLRTTDGIQDSQYPVVDMFYGSVARSLYSCLKAMLVGQSWGELMDPLIRVHWFYAFIFLVFIVFSILALLNIVTGVFVNSALEKSENEREMVATKEVNRRRACVEHLKQIFLESDLNKDGILTHEEFSKHMCTSTVEPYIAAMNIDTSNMEELFHLLDRDHNGGVTLHEFVETLMEMMHYSTKGRDRHFAGILKEQVRTRHNLKRFSEMTDNRLSAILADSSGKKVTMDPNIPATTNGFGRSRSESSQVKSSFGRSALGSSRSSSGMSKLHLCPEEPLDRGIPA